MGILYKGNDGKRHTKGWIITPEPFLRRCQMLLPVAAFIFFVSSFSASAQSTGEYRSNNSGNWSTLNTWQRYNGSGWATPTGVQGYPGQFASSSGASVTVSDNVTLNVSPANSIGSLTVNNQALLSTSGNPNLIVGGNLTIAAYFALWSSDMSFGNGDLTIGGALTIEGVCSLTFGTGELNVNGATTIGAAGILTNNGTYSTPGTVSMAIFFGAAGVFQNNGTANLTNTGVGVLSGAGRWTQGASSTLNYSGSTITVTTFQASATGNEVNYDLAGAQTVDNPSGSTYYHLTLSGSGVKASSSNYTVAGNLTIGGSAQFDVDTGNDDMSVGGNWTVISTNGDPFLQGTESVTFNGSTAQIISTVSGTETFYDLLIDNSFGASPQITVNSNITVTDVLTMDDGNVSLNGYTFSLTNSANTALDHGLSSGSGWMYGGTFSRARPASTPITVGTAHSLFPLGSAGDWRPFFAGQNSTASTAGTMTVTHTNSTSTSDVSFPESISRRHNSYWTPRTTASGGTYTLRAGGTNFGTITSNTHIRMSTSTGVTGTHAAGSGGPTDWRVNRTAVTLANLNANNFHVASANSSSPLPIELLSFSAQLKNNFVELKWSTASETNNDFFTIERSTNVEHFEPILKLEGAGTTKELNEYNVIDPSPLYGRSFYRLKQTDFDGKFTYSSVRVIDYDGPEHATLTAFPNPTSGKDLSIRIDGLRDAQQVPVTILNMQGQTVYEKTIVVKSPGVITEEIFREKVLPSGLYIIKAGNTLYLEQKIVIE